MDRGDTPGCWRATALVLLMTPGLAFFLRRHDQVEEHLNMMMNVVHHDLYRQRALGDLRLLARLPGRPTRSSVTSASRPGQLGQRPRHNGGIYGHPAAGLRGLPAHVRRQSRRRSSAARIRRRTKFLTWGIFVTLWVTLVYFPVAHWVFYFGDKAPDGTVTGEGWLAARGVEDFAGGTAVHINAGAAGLALAIVLGRRIGSRRTRRARTTCLSCSSARASCGSAGSASTPARRSPPTARPRSRS